MTEPAGSSDMAAHVGYLAIAARGMVVIELGVRRGISTAALLSTAAEVWSCDIDPARVPASWFTLENWHFILGPSTHVRTASAMPQWCDVLLIDTSHEYEQTLGELAIYWPRVRPGGLALLHDTQWEPLDPDTNGGCMCRELDAPGGPVTRAIDAFTAAHGLQWSNRPGSYGLGIIRKPDE